MSARDVNRVAGAAATPRLVAMAGLPGAGKSAVARALAERRDAVYLSVDPIEDALHRAGLAPSFETGLAAYLVAEVIAREHLARAQWVIIDAANYVEPARAMWRTLASAYSAELVWLEVVCDPEVHRRRLATRVRGLAALEPTWDEVQTRTVEPWSADDQGSLITLDTTLGYDIEDVLARVDALSTPRQPW